MTKKTTFEPGEFCWVDLVAHDMPAAVAWYSDRFGWKAETQDTYGGPPYAMFKMGDAVVGGIGQMSDEMKAAGVPPMWNNYVATADCEATEAKARELGATVTVPTMEVPGQGKLAFFMDPSGAAIATWQTTRDDGMQILFNEHGGLSWNELMMRDPEQARDFYGKLFGWDFKKMPMEGTDYWILKVGERDTGGMMTMPEGEHFEGVPNHWMCYFAVDDCAAFAASVESSGGSIKVPPMKIQVGTFSVVADPQGGVFSVIQLDPDQNC